MKRPTLLLAGVLCCSALLYGQRTDLSGLKFCIDPGHGGHNPANDRYVVPDPGTEFWESESNFQKAMRLDTLLRAQGAWVILTRYTNDYPNDADEPSLSARWQLANANNVNWFHSIHSNATGWASNTTVDYTLVLVKEDQATRQAVFPQAVTMGNLIGPSIQSKIRTQPRSTWTYLDFTFYGGPGVGFNLGVLNGLTMPGELSEGSFHDYFPETRQLMNNAYRKMEAYAIRNAFMQYFGVPADTLCRIAGVQRDFATTKPINFSRVRLLPIGRVVTGDQYSNGYYMFDNVPAGAYTVRFETPGYGADSVQVTLGSAATAFVDRALVPQANPTVLLTSPVNSDTTVVVTSPLVITFSKPMDTASVRTAFSVSPAVPGTLQWANSNSVMTYMPTVSLGAWVTYEVRVDSTARSATGQAFDGNGDGFSGDPFVMRFKTKYVDMFPPAITSSFPGTLVQLPAPTPAVNVTFDEPLYQASVNTSNFVVQQVGGSLQARFLEYREENGQGGVTIYLPSGVGAGNSYQVRVSRAADLLGNAMPTTASIVWDFSIAGGSYSTTVVDSANPGTTGLSAPRDATDKAGIDSLEVVSSAARSIGVISGNRGSLSMRCVWDTTKASWGVRIPLDTSSTGGRIRFLKTGTILRAYVYGDGSRSQVRFCVADSVEAFPSGPALHREVSRWFTIDWVGWRALLWDLDADSVGSGPGNGVLEGSMRFDGLQFRYVPGASKRILQSYVDQIEVLQRGIAGVEEGPSTLIRTYVLCPAYPNPFNPSTKIGFRVSGVKNGSGDWGQGSSWVKLAVYDMLGREVSVLLNEQKEPGSYTTTWNANGSHGTSSGVYVARLTVRNGSGSLQFIASQKIILMR